jgi:hypothetical protein
MTHCNKFHPSDGGKAVPVEYIILTRYNLALPWSKRPGIHRDEHWLGTRSELLQRISLPSVLRCRGASRAHWLMLCAADSPLSVVRLMDNLNEDHPWLVPIYVEGPSSYGSIVRTWLENSRLQPDYIATTRLDSDDALGKHYFPSLDAALTAEIRRRGTLTQPRVWNFPFGWQALGGRMLAQVDLANPFISVVEPYATGAPLITSLGYSHRSWRRSGFRIHQLWDPRPAWLQVLHASNEGNRPCGLPLPRCRTIEERFGLPEPDLFSLGRDPSCLELLEAGFRQLIRIVETAV